MKGILFVSVGILLAAGVVALGIGCGDSPPTPAADSSAQASSDSTGADIVDTQAAVPDGGGSSPDDVVVFENPGHTPVPIGAAPTGLAAPTVMPASSDIQWIVPPHIPEPWSMEAVGVLPEGTRLNDPDVDNQPAFAVHHRGIEEPMVVLLPDDRVWDTDDTVAPTSFEFEGQQFRFSASSPLLGDADNLELRLLGYRGDEPAVLAVVPIE